MLADSLAPLVNSTSHWCVVLQRYRSPVADHFFKLGSFTGGEIGTIVAFTLLTSLPGGLHKAPVQVVAWGLALSLCSVVKCRIQLKRPDLPAIVVLETCYMQEPGFPSSHTCVATTFGAFFGGFGALYAVWVGLSRLYLGVHSGLDVVGGAMLGVLCGFGVQAVVLWVSVPVFVGCVVPVLWMLQNDRVPSNSAWMDSLSALGNMSGYALGTLLVDRAPPPRETHEWLEGWPMLGILGLRCLCFLVSVAATRTVCKKTLFPPKSELDLDKPVVERALWTSVAQFVTYMSMGLAAVVVMLMANRGGLTFNA